jgi:hypothetical protein
MANNNDSSPILPSKVPLQLAATNLKLSSLNEKIQILTILQYQREFRLPLNADLNEEIRVQKVSDGIDEHIDEHGNITLLSNGQDSLIRTAGKSCRLGQTTFCPSGLLISTMNIEGIDYYLLNTSGTEITPLCIPLSKIYIDKEDLATFINSGDNKLQPYSDPASEFYAPELDLAVRLHQLLRVQKEGNQNLNMKERAQICLRKHYPSLKLSDAKVARLATIIGDGKKHPK